MISPEGWFASAALSPFASISSRKFTKSGTFAFSSSDITSAYERPVADSFRVIFAWVMAVRKVKEVCDGAPVSSVAVPVSATHEPPVVPGVRLLTYAASPVPGLWSSVVHRPGSRFDRSCTVLLMNVWR